MSNTKDIEESWWDKFWELVDASENYVIVDERITAREKLEQLVTQHHEAEVGRVRKEAWAIGYAQCEADNNLLPTVNVDYSKLTSTTPDKTTEV